MQTDAAMQCNMLWLCSDLVVVAVQLAQADALGVQARCLYSLKAQIPRRFLVQHCQGVTQHSVTLGLATTCAHSVTVSTCLGHNIASLQVPRRA